MRAMILLPQDLPAEGAGYETFAVEFKGHIPEEPAFELGKDVAAFANSAAERLSIGPRKTSGGRLSGGISQ